MHQSLGQRTAAPPETAAAGDGCDGFQGRCTCNADAGAAMRQVEPDRAAVRATGSIREDGAGEYTGRPARSRCLPTRAPRVPVRLLLYPCCSPHHITGRHIAAALAGVWADLHCLHGLPDGARGACYALLAFPSVHHPWKPRDDTLQWPSRHFAASPSPLRHGRTTDSGCRRCYQSSARARARLGHWVRLSR